jgi:hypothetical protein
MAPSSNRAKNEAALADKPRKSIKLTPGKEKQLRAALAVLKAHYGDTLASLGSLTEAQRADVLAHSPVLAELVALVEPLRG